MNCGKAQRWISLEMDGELSPRRLSALRAHLEGCPSCRQVREDWVQVGAELRDRKPPAGQAPEAAWADVRRAIRNQAPAAEPAAEWVFGAPLRWAAVAAALLVMAGGAVLFMKKAPMREAAREPATQVEMVETGLPDAAPMVYEDAESGLTVIWVVEANRKEGGHVGS
ncbi:MAG: anti-sigma factor [Planctomycetota bacterium]